MKVAVVRAIEREGYPGYFAAHRCWMSSNATLVEVVDEEDDPDAEEGAVDGIDAPDERLIPVMEPDPLNQGHERHAKDLRTGKPLFTTGFYKHGDRRKISRHKIGLRTLKVLRAQSGFLSVEVHTVDKIEDVRVDDQTGMIEVANEEYVAKLEEELRRAKAQLESVKGRVPGKDAEQPTPKRTVDK